MPCMWKSPWYQPGSSRATYETSTGSGTKAGPTAGAVHTTATSHCDEPSGSMAAMPRSTHHGPGSIGAGR
jgi:hypothetical protein